MRTALENDGDPVTLAEYPIGLFECIGELCLNSGYAEKTPEQENEGRDCCIEGCVSPRHLSWKTPKANCADRLIHGTLACGERSGTAKLTESDVRRIRAMGPTHKRGDIAKLFPVSIKAIDAILRGRSWAHLK